LSDYCGPGLAGPLCEVCPEGEYLSIPSYQGEAYTCEACPDLTWRVVLLVVLLSVVALIVLVVQSKKNGASPTVDRLFAQITFIINTIGFRAKFKIAVGMYQILAQIGYSMGIPMPEYFNRFLARLAWVRLDLGILVSNECLGRSATRLLLKLVSPAVLVAVAVFGTTGITAVRHSRRGGDCVPGIMSGLASSLPLALLLTFVLYTPASVAVFRSFGCESYLTNVSNLSQTVFLLRDDPQLECASSNRPPSPIFDVALAGLIAWPIFVPTMYFVLLLASRSAIKSRRPTRLSRSISFIHEDYQVGCYLWEPVDMMRRLTLLGFVQFIDKEQLHLLARLVVGATISLCFLFAVLWSRPYRKSVDNILAALVHLCLAVVLILCCMVELFQRSTTLLEDGTTASKKVLGFGNTDGIGEILVAFPMFTYGSMTLVIIMSLVTAKRPQLIHDSLTGRPAVLSLERQQKYHLFLSHIWGTGQDQVASIKRQLCLLVPGISIFLDVDDLEEISALERYIDETAVVLIFLSKGYFRSKNCLREVVASTKKRKPIVLVWEPDQSKGGSPVEALKAELYERRELLAELGSTPEECEHYIFEESQTDGRPIVPWFRIKDFQLRSLRMIVRTMLSDSPAYVQKGKGGYKAISLYMPGEINPSRMSSKAPVCLYASPLNPGAAEVAQELTSSLDGVFVTSRPPIGCDAPELELPAWDETEPVATHFLLYLSDQTFVGEDVGKRYGQQVRAFREREVEYIMLHEADPERHGCEFGTFFSTTPQDLIDNGIYGALAISFFWGLHREVSIGLVGKVLGLTSNGGKGTIISKITGRQKAMQQAIAVKAGVTQNSAPRLRMAAIISRLTGRQKSRVDSPAAVNPRLSHGMRSAMTVNNLLAVGKEAPAKGVAGARGLARSVTRKLTAASASMMGESSKATESCSVEVASVGASVDEDGDDAAVLGGKDLCARTTLDVIGVPEGWPPGYNEPSTASNDGEELTLDISVSLAL